MTARAAHSRADAAARSGRRSGQAMVETIVVMIFLCLAFFLTYEYANLFNVHTVLDYAAARAARARTVGFDDFMITKSVRVATASVAGRCRSLTDENAGLSNAMIISRMGSYMETPSEAYTRGVLDFELWDSDKLGWTVDEVKDDNSELRVRVWQNHPLYGSEGDCSRQREFRRLTGEAAIENHYSLYLK